jgi:preprotein translocase subunit SecD
MRQSTIHSTFSAPVSTDLVSHSPIFSSCRPADVSLVELPGIDNPERVRKLLQGTAQLEFWETYENQEVYPYLMQANQRLREITGRGHNRACLLTKNHRSTDPEVAPADSLAAEFLILHHYLMS